MDLPIQSIDQLQAAGEAAARAPDQGNPYPVGSAHHFHWERGNIAAQLHAVHLAEQFTREDVARVFAVPAHMLHARTRPSGGAGQ